MKKNPAVSQFCIFNIVSPKLHFVLAFKTDRNHNGNLI